MQAKENARNFEEQELRRVVCNNPKNRPYQSTYPIIRHWEKDKKPSITGHEVVEKGSQSKSVQEETKEQSFGI